MGSAAFFAENSLHRELEEPGWKFDIPLVPSEKDETSFFMTGAFDMEKVKGLKK